MEAQTINRVSLEGGKMPVGGVKGHFQHASRALCRGRGPLLENPSWFCFVSGSSQERTLRERPKHKDTEQGGWARDG